MSIVHRSPWAAPGGSAAATSRWNLKHRESDPLDPDLDQEAAAVEARIRYLLRALKRCSEPEARKNLSRLAALQTRLYNIRDERRARNASRATEHFQDRDRQPDPHIRDTPTLQARLSRRY